MLGNSRAPGCPRHPQLPAALPGPGHVVVRRPARADRDHVRCVRPDEIDVRSGVRPRLRVRCVSQGTTAALLLLHQAQVWELVVLQAVYGAANAFFMPAQIGLIPAVVRSGQLREANALMSLSRTAAGVVGPAVGGTLVALISPGVAVAGDAATFLVSAGSLALLRLEWPAREAMGASMLTEFREGLAGSGSGRGSGC